MKKSNKFFLIFSLTSSFVLAQSAKPSGVSSSQSAPEEFIAEQESNIQQPKPLNQTPTERRKKILIFSGKGGGGHLAAAQAITNYLKDTYDITVEFMFDEVLKDKDIVQNITKGKFSGEEMWNFLAKKKIIRPLNIMYQFGRRAYTRQRESIAHRLTDHISQINPDMIISVIPLVNLAIMDAAQNLSIPFMLIPTDLDPEMFLNGIKYPRFNKFRLGLSYNIKEINDEVAKYNIPKESILYVGFPVKKCFFSPKACGNIESLNIPKNKPIILILMGSQGSTDLLKYSQALTKAETPMHLLIAIGKSENMREKIKALSFPKHITYTIIGFTDLMPEIMQQANLFISKPGGVSVNEAIYRNLPMLLDASSTLLKWENFNLKVVVDQKFGEAVKYIDSSLFGSVAKQVDALFSDSKKLKLYKNNLQSFQKTNPQISIRNAVRTLI